MTKRYCLLSLTILITMVTILFSNLFAKEPQKGKPLDFTAGNPPLFPFKIEKGSPNNITNVQTWQQWSPAGTHGMLHVDGEQFVDQSGPRYFMATNTCFTANFINREQAELLAKTLARFGIGVVRLHHMDSYCIWGKNINRTQTEIDPEQLDRLDYLIDQFHKNGIYVNINLHVSRKLDGRDGFPDADLLPTHTKGVDNFDPHMIELQKKYAKDLLTHVNPYTKLAYVDDPGVAMIEINNENSVVASWAWTQLDSLPEHYSKILRDKWNQWLLKKYKTTANLRKAWDCKNVPLSENIIPNGRFANPKSPKSLDTFWQLQTDDLSKQTYTIQKVNGVETFRIKVDQQGRNDWIPQFYRTGLSVEKDQVYTISFEIKCDQPDDMYFGVRRNHDPWDSIGLAINMKMDSNWKKIKRTFIATDSDNDVRFSLGSFTAGNSYEIRNVSFQKGGQIDLNKDQSLESGNVPWPLRHGGIESIPNQFVFPDWAEFLAELENDYWQDMYRYVKNDLKAKPPVTGTQLQYGFWYAQGRLDYCDIHAYWNHPHFPRKDWDSNDWYIGSEPLVRKIQSQWSTLPSLASARILGRPLTVSEYDHPYPNLYCAEGNLMAAAFGAFQNWSILYQFAWSHNGSNLDPSAQTVFFDMSGNQAKMAHLPACYALIARGDVQRGPGRYIYSADMSSNDELKITGRSLQGYHRNLKELNLDPTMSLAVCTGINLTDLKLKANQNLQKIKSWKDLPEELGNPEKKWVKNEFKEITWNWQDNAEFFQVNTSGTKVLSGFVCNQKFDFDSIVIKPGKTCLNWATISMVQANAKPNDGSTKPKQLLPGRYLIAATGLVQNTNAKFVETGPKQISTAKALGGDNGVTPVLCEGVPMEFVVKGINPARIQAWSLDASGNRQTEIKAVQNQNDSILSFGPQYKTLWYELEVK